jgi:hypothetical protein
MSQRAFTYRLLFLLAFALLIVFGINAYIDSRWVFGTVNDYNTKRPIFDERSQKTNFLVHQKPTFNNLILGSSRASYFPTKILKGKWFNYAVSGMYPDEYLEYAKIAEKYATNQKLDTIIIGLDFWATCQCAIVKYKSAKEIHRAAKSWIKQATNLVSKDALDESSKTKLLNQESSQNEAYYNLPFLAKNRTESNDSLKEIKLKEQNWYYRNDVFGSVYEYNTEYLTPLRELISSFPNTHFILYTSPLSPKLLALQKELNRQKDIDQWLSELSTLDAELIITDQSQFTSEMFFDSHHLKPEYFSIICNKFK